MNNQSNVKNQDPQQIKQDSVNKTPTAPTPLKSKSSYRIILIILLVILALCGGFFLFNNIQKQNEPPSSSTTPVISSPIFPISVYGPSEDYLIKDTQSGPAPCQPEFFDPKIDKFYKVKQSGSPSELYEVQGSDGVYKMMINGWDKEGENKIILPSPFNVTIYKFGCASSFSYVIDLTKNGNRQDLYTHVFHFSFSEDGKKLFLVNSVNDQGTWTLHKRIINIETKEINEIPNLRCVSEFDGFWQGDRLLTYNLYNLDSSKSDYHTDICIWNESAKLISRVDAALAWGAASRNFLAEKIGLLPTMPDIFYAYTSKDENTCSLFLADIVNYTPLYVEDRFATFYFPHYPTKSVDILDKRNYPESYYCISPEVEFDFSNFYFDHGILKYRIEKDKQPSGQIIWGDWQTIQMTSPINTQ